jgi:hypothetical protein
MNRIIKWAEDTGFKLSTEKTKAIMFSRGKFPIITRPRMKIWAKREKIKQFRQQRILRVETGHIPHGEPTKKAY